jgi:hypothetical protein
MCPSISCGHVKHPLSHCFIEVGGVGLNAAQIGYVLGGYRAIMALFMATASSRIIGYLGERRSFILAVFSILVLWTIFPVINLSIRNSGLSTSAWAVIGLLVLPLCGMEMGYGRHLTKHADLG